MTSFYSFDFPRFSDTNGTLVPVELDDSFPFPVERVYYLRDVPENITRGAHAHHIEEEVFVCIQGKCLALIDSDGNGKQEVWLDSPTKAIYVGTMVWHEFNSFSKDAVLLAFSSTRYLPGPTNYEPNYEKFLELVRSEN
jgi:dTDP-4-dehydrorhamnose 3,5-epimerase-like enzyme